MRDRVIPRRSHSVAFAILALLSTCWFALWADEPLAFTSLFSARRTPVVQAVERVRSSVVNIHGRKSVPASDISADEQQVNGMGTGIVIDERGYILTNYHVVEGVAEIKVTLDEKKTLIGRLISHDPKTDLAVIKINSKEKLPVIHLGTSEDLMIGETVIAVGNAYGYQHTVTLGIISSLGRDVPVSEQQKYDNLIQTDASINPGNSGGPLLNIHGETIGINVAVRVGAQGIGFAIPVDEALEVASRLMSVELIDRFSHGIECEWSEESGKRVVLVSSVRSQSAAAKSGIIAGDQMISIDDRAIERPLDIERALLGQPSGREVEVNVMRSGQPKLLSLVVDREASREVVTGQRAWTQLGLRLAPASSSTIRRYNPAYRGGLRVTGVRSGSPAAQQGITQGDILLGIHRWETISLDNLAYILSSDEFEAAQPVRFYILRGSETLYGRLRVAVRP